MLYIFLHENNLQFIILTLLHIYFVFLETK